MASAERMVSIIRLCQVTALVANTQGRYLDAAYCFDPTVLNRIEVHMDRMLAEYLVEEGNAARAIDDVVLLKCAFSDTPQ